MAPSCSAARPEAGRSAGGTARVGAGVTANRRAPGRIDPLRAATAAQEIGIVVMHGKGGNPGRLVNLLADALETEGSPVANIDMLWSGKRHYDVELDAALGGHLARARQMRADGRGREQAEFADYEGSRGTDPVTTTAASDLGWFDPDGAHTSRVFRQVMPGVPMLFVSATRAYPGLLRFRDQSYAAIPAHPLKRMPVIDSDHLNAPAAAAPEVLRWVREVAAQ